ncbi:MAG TPA: class I SAM-dependent methyltransferase [Nitrolancea sp.]|nr:class I SAM-dependent methyltransferase [Nitrolancea sp.]
MNRLSQLVRGRTRRLWARAVMQLAMRDSPFWRLARTPTRRIFDGLAPRWDTMVAGEESVWFQALDGALDHLPANWKPARILEIGAGTGRGTFHLAAHFPSAITIGLDLSPAMLHRGQERAANEQLPAVNFVAGDGAALPITTKSVDLAVLLNAPPFFDEIARVVRPGGAIVLAFSHGPRQPMYVDGQTAARHLRRHGFGNIIAGWAGEGTFVIGRRAPASGNRSGITPGDGNHS